MAGLLTQGKDKKEVVEHCYLGECIVSRYIVSKSTRHFEALIQVMKKKGSNSVTRARLESARKEEESNTSSTVNHWVLTATGMCVRANRTARSHCRTTSST